MPLALWTVLVAAINLTLFVAIRGRWGRELPFLVVAAVVGTLAGNLLATLLEVDVLVLGEFHLIGAVIGGQLALITTSAVATLLAGTGGSTGRRDGAGSGR